MQSGICLRFSFSNKFVRQPTVILDLHLLDLLPPTMRLGLLVVRLRKIALPCRWESVPRCRSTTRLLLDRHLVRRRRLVHRPLVRLRLVLRRRGVLCVDAFRGGRGSAPTPAVTRSASRGRSARGDITQRGGGSSGSARGRGTRGGRGFTSTPATTKSASSVPTAKTISELHRLSYAFTVKVGFPDVAHRDGTFGFTEYVYAVGTTQPNIPQTIKEARATPEAAQWNTAAEHEIASLNNRQVYKLVPCSAVPAGRKRINSKWVLKRKADSSFKARVVAQGWN